MASNSGGPLPELKGVAAALIEHAIPESSARLLAAAGEALRNEAALLGIEHAASFDIDSAEPAGPLRTGRMHEVDISAQVEAMRDLHRYICLHTHRLDTAFSERDLDVLLRNARLQSIAAVGHDGTWHLLSKVPGTEHVDPAVATRALAVALARLSPAYRQEVHAGRATPEDALRTMLHEVWLLLAPALGLRYDRI